MVMARMRSGFAVIGETQQLPGYSLLLVDDPGVDHLSDLPMPARTRFLQDLALLGEAVEAACKPRGLRRINYEVLGNSLGWLHAHVHARYDWEPPERVGCPVWLYPDRFDEAHAYDDSRHGELRESIARELNRHIRLAH
jgi:diadenosine tetraphosphate (Ap4A) HIT family hydrolase